ncbi:MAG: DNA/RNA nuclease SfsA, partial [Thermoanaerobaculum sp.]|nr:DNA/RNA nuclease SfsA [Thermoanaerobaculum sp.]
TQGSSLPFRVELVDAEGCLVGINTWRAAPLAEEALTAGLVDLPGLQRPFSIRREVAPLPGSRLDLLLEDGQGPYWVEVKNITWVVDGVALFPDAVTQRGAKHLRLLAELAAQGERTAVIYVVQRGDSQKVQAAASVDPAYARAVWDAAQAGVEFLAFDVAVSPRELRPRRALPVAVEAPA